MKTLKERIIITMEKFINGSHHFHTAAESILREIGRCEDCKHERGHTHYKYFCSFWERDTAEDGYCHRFVRRK